MLKKISNILEKMKIFDIQTNYINGLGFICTSPFFTSIYWIIVPSLHGYEIRSYRNNYLDKIYKDKDFCSYHLAKDLLNLINLEIEYELNEHD